MSQHGISYEVIKLVRVALEHGVGVKLTVGERMGVDLDSLRRRRGGGGGGGGKGVDGGGNVDVGENGSGDRVQSKSGNDRAIANVNAKSRFDVDSRDLRDLYICAK